MNYVLLGFKLMYLIIFGHQPKIWIMKSFLSQKNYLHNVFLLSLLVYGKMY